MEFLNAALQTSLATAGKQKLIVNDELEMTWMEAVVVNWEVCSTTSQRDTEENHEKSQPAQTVAGVRFEDRASVLQSENQNR
jgi:hypothetical protein